MFKRVFFVMCLLFILVPASWAANWYVNKASNGNGTEWTNAWNDFGNIQWSSIHPGDTIYISGGTTSRTYTNRLSIIGVHGSSGSPITIRVGQDANHNGDVIIMNNGDYAGVYIKDSTYVTMNGNVNGEQHMIIRECGNTGVLVDAGESHHIICTYLEIDNNGNYQDEDGFVVKRNGSVYPYVELSYSKIHDNFQDQIKGYGGGYAATGFGAIIIHHNEIYNVHDDGFESGAGGIDFYNNEMHTRAPGGGAGHTDGLQFYGEYYRIYNNIFHNFDHETLSSTAYIYMHSASGRASKYIYVYNNILYEDQMYDGDTSLRGISFAPQTGTTEIAHVLIANNTVIGMPAHGMSVKFDTPGIRNIVDVTIVNNLVYNCYTNGGGQAINVISDTDEYFTNRAGNKKNKENFNIADIATALLGGLFVSCSAELFGIGEVWIDYNLISAGPNGSDEIGFCGPIISYEELVEDYHINVHGIHTDNPYLDAEYKPLSNSPVRNNGVSLAEYFTTDLAGISRGTGWDIGAYEY